MTVVPPFPILRLPSLPFNEVISFMDLAEQVCMSFASKRTMGMMHRKQKLSLEVGTDKIFHPFYHIACKNQNGTNLLDILITYRYFSKNRLCCNIFDRKELTNLGNNTLKTYSKYGIEGYQKMTSLLCNLFKIESLSITFSSIEAMDYSKIAAHVQNVQTKFKIDKIKIQIRTSNLTGKENIQRNFLEKLKDVPEIHMEIDDMTYHHIGGQSDANSCYCNIFNASWFTLEDLNLLTKCKKIEMWNLKWKHQKVNHFLKKWIKSSTMENLELVIVKAKRQWAVDSVSKGISLTSNKKVVTINGSEVELKKCFELQRNDGIKANLYTWHGSLVMQTYQ